jgi:hypothetical protein
LQGSSLFLRFLFQSHSDFFSLSSEDILKTFNEVRCSVSPRAEAMVVSFLSF